MISCYVMLTEKEEGCYVFRILMGYLFLTNVLLVLIQAEDVLTIFYDVLALQFVQQLDDIAFRLARMDVFGRRLQRACTAYWFDAEFEYRKGNYDVAFEHLRHAVELDDRLPYDEPWGWMVPVRHVQPVAQCSKDVRTKQFSLSGGGKSEEI